MSIEEPGLGEIFTIRVHKEYSGFEWANTYEFRANQTDPISYAQLMYVGNRIAMRESQFHLGFVTFPRIVISTYFPDSRPYDPTTFATLVPQGLSGSRTIVGGMSQAMPLHVCAFVRYFATTGRTGRKFYRGVLTETDCAFYGDNYIIRDAAIAEIEAPLVQLLQDIELLGSLVLAKGSPIPTDVRPVRSVQVSNQTVLKQTGNRYYDQRAR